MKVKDKKIDKVIEFVKNSWLYFIFYFVIGLMQILVNILPKYSNFIQGFAVVIYMYFLIKLIFSINESDYLDRVFKFTIIVIVNSPLLVYSIVLFLRTIPGYFVHVSNSSTWIGFAGSIIGGSLTLFAVIFAFILEKKSREIELDKTQVPKLHIDTKIKINNDNNYDESMFCYGDNHNNANINLELELRNISNYSAKNIKIVHSYIEVYNSILYGFNPNTVALYKEDLKEKMSENITDIIILFGEYSKNLYLPIYINKKFINSDDHPLYLLNTEIQYTSQFEQITYKLNSTITFDLSYTSFDNNNKKTKKNNNIYFLKIKNVSNSLSIVESIVDD